MIKLESRLLLIKRKREVIPLRNKRSLGWLLWAPDIFEFLGAPFKNGNIWFPLAMLRRTRFRVWRYKLREDSWRFYKWYSRCALLLHRILLFFTWALASLIKSYNIQWWHFLLFNDWFLSFCSFVNRCALLDRFNRISATVSSIFDAVLHVQTALSQILKLQ